jgi:acyl carrier protein
MKLEKIHGAKAKLEIDSTAAVQQLVKHFEDETGVQITDGNISGFRYYNTVGLSQERETIKIRFELEPT